jgi:mycofactocin precursor
MNEQTDLAEPPDAGDTGPEHPPVEPLIEDDDLVEEVSIDGMCGVY